MTVSLLVDLVILGIFLSVGRATLSMSTRPFSALKKSTMSRNSCQYTIGNRLASSNLSL